MKIKLWAVAHIVSIVKVQASSDALYGVTFRVATTASTFPVDEPQLSEVPLVRPSPWFSLLLDPVGALSIASSSRPLISLLPREWVRQSSP